MMSFVRKSYYGAKYIIPAEYDVLIHFSPISYDKGSEETLLDEGIPMLQTKWINDTSEYKMDHDAYIFDRLDSDKDGIPDFEETFRYLVEINDTLQDNQYNQYNQLDDFY
jgi:hypothetical protein